MHYFVEGLLRLRVDFESVSLYLSILIIYLHLSSLYVPPVHDIYRIFLLLSYPLATND